MTHAPNLFIPVDVTGSSVTVLRTIFRPNHIFVRTSILCFSEITVLFDWEAITQLFLIISKWNFARSFPTSFSTRVLNLDIVSQKAVLL